ncbi:MAG: hypothetical protein IPP19_16870 [Verrucomicrobia bacterium]|nr:hypothetical protein [Verrucomicrobiota bacterium]
MPRAPARSLTRALPVLYRISSLIGRTEDPRLALPDDPRRNHRHASPAAQASSGSIALLNPDTGKLEIEFSRPPAQRPTRRSCASAQGITGWVVFHGRHNSLPT